MKELYEKLMNINEQEEKQADDIPSIVDHWSEILGEGSITEMEFLKYVIEDVFTEGFTIDELLKYLESK